MKKFIVFLAVAFIGVSSSAQKATLILDKINSEGGRSAGTNYVIASNSSDTSMYFCLLYVGTPNRELELWSIGIRLVSSKSFSIPEGSPMLIKLDDDEIIEVKQATETQKTEDKLGKYDSSRQMTLYSMYGSYRISEDNLKKIISHSVVKIRIACSEDLIDYVYASDMVSSVLREEYDLITNAIFVKKDIYSDF